MSTKERDIEEGADLYEEILNSEYLDQYEGLLNHYRNNKKDLKRTFKKNKNDLLDSFFNLQLKQEISLRKR